MRVTRKPHVAWRHYLRTVPCRRDVSPFPFSHGRTAMTYGLRALGVPRDAEVLCPHFICHTVPESLERAGLRVRFHPVGDDLAPDWRALERVPRGAVAGLVMVHYFGVPQDAARYRAKPTLPETIVREDGAAMRRWERLVCFPLHQDVEPAALEAVLRPLTERIGPASGRASALEPEAGGAPRHPSEV